MTRLYTLWRSKVIWWMRWLICTTVVITLFYLIENVRGKHAYQQALKRYQAAGWRIDIDAILGPIPAPDENFAKSELMLDAKNGFEPKALEIKWHEYEVGLPEIPYPEYYFPKQRFAAVTRELAARKILRILNRPEYRMGMIRGAISRPHCQYINQREIDVSSDLWFMSCIRSSCSNLRASCVANHALGNNNKSAEDVCALLKMSRQFGDGGSMVSFTIGVAMYRVNSGLVWYGLREGGWNLENLESIATAIREHSPTPSTYKTAKEIETHYFNFFADKMEQERLNRNLRFGLDLEITSFNETLNNALVDTAFMLSPPGWFEQNKAHYLDGQVTRVHRPLTFWPYQYLSDYSLTSLSGVDRTIKKSIRSDELLLKAIELEKLKLKTGAYPSSSINSKISHLFDENGRPVLFYTVDPVVRKRLADTKIEYDDFRETGVLHYGTPVQTRSE